ncbi:hypothetical protein PUR61_09510 [Streptomyces sp. BE20]|nr:hypothetical protein [Streptomyces sp. BE20]MEE1822428.1 hypothetical protein [Streptomyces sp. BE20]
MASAGRIAASGEAFQLTKLGGAALTAWTAIGLASPARLRRRPAALC